jgi:hypothetical protein
MHPSQSLGQVACASTKIDRTFCSCGVPSRVHCTIRCYLSQREGKHLYACRPITQQEANTNTTISRPLPAGHQPHLVALHDDVHETEDVPNRFLGPCVARTRAACFGGCQLLWFVLGPWQLTVKLTKGETALSLQSLSN